jgi:uncharacterized membrane protein YeiB
VFLDAAPARVPFVGQLAAYGDATALIAPGGQVSYAELAARVNDAAERLGATRRLVLQPMRTDLDAIVGYLGALGSFLERPGRTGRLAPLRDAGRMALSSYLLQSLLCAAFFAWLRFYDQLSVTAALGVVLVVWVVMLSAASLTMRRFQRGPVEHVWRRLTYGRG